MTNLLTRIKNTVLADINDVLDRKEQKNPIALLNQYLRESEKEAEKVKKLVERQYKLQEEFIREHAAAIDLAGKRKRQAEIAEQAGEVELQQFALQEYVQYESRAERLKELKNKSAGELIQLERKYEEMKHKLKDMHIRRMELMGKENVTRAHHEIGKVLNNEDYSNKPFSRFQEIETYIEKLEQRMTESYHRDTIDAKIAQLEKEMKKAE